jgi:V8-like Glu-specific endopeptidase
VVTYTWNTGTVVMTLIDGSSVGDGDDDVDGVWIGGLNGVLSSSANAQVRISRGIDQAFTQSPYLGGSGS